MKVLVASLLAVGAFASERVHKFQAESKFMCKKCQSAVEYYTSAQGDDAEFNLCKDKSGVDYTSICDEVSSQIASVNKMMFAGRDAQAICEGLQLCGDTSDSEFAGRSAINMDIIEQVNADASIPWTASVQPRFKEATLKDVRAALGTIVDPEYRYALGVRHRRDDHGSDVPSEFDSRDEWPNCANVIGHIRDQSSCGCCWAFGSTEAYNDRLCIATDGDFQQLLSTEDTCACCNFLKCDSDGCDGGQPTMAWEWFESNGVVSGGDYDDIGGNDTCDPFTLPPCAHHVNSTEYPPCPSTEYSTPRCETSCSNTAYPKSWSEDTHTATKAYSLRTVDDIMSDLYSYGTVTAAFTVYEDFLSYTSGVYVHTSGEELGGHAIKIFGYGTDDGTEYWWCANSWNDSWGDEGFFKIKKGVDECGIESDVSSGHAS